MNEPSFHSQLRQFSTRVAGEIVQEPLDAALLLNEANLPTLLIDLLTSEEEMIDLRTAHLRFDIGLLAERLIAATDWLTQYPGTRHLRVSYFAPAPRPVQRLLRQKKILGIKPSTPMLWPEPERNAMALPVTFKSVGAATHDAAIASLHRLLGDSPATGKALGSGAAVARGMSARRTFG